MIKPKSTHGGSRTNAGRKPKPNTFTISRNVTHEHKAEVDRLLYNLRKGTNLTIQCANETEYKYLTNHLAILRSEVKK